MFVQEPKAYTASVGETVRFTCVGIYPQVSYPDVCITHSFLYVLMLLPGCLPPGWLLLLLLLLLTDCCCRCTGLLVLLPRCCCLLLRAATG